MINKYDYIGKRVLFISDSSPHEYPAHKGERGDIDNIVIIGEKIKYYDITLDSGYGGTYRVELVEVYDRV